MKSHVKFNAIRLACAAALGVSTMFAGVAQAASTTADATATIITPISIAKVNDLRFGTFAVGGSLGTVVIATGGGRSATGGVVLPAGSAAGGAASFTVTGEADATYTVTLPAGAATITKGGGVNMTVDTWTSNPGTGVGAGTLTLGTETLLVGGTLNAAASQASGVYTGSFSVAVEYN